METTTVNLGADFLFPKLHGMWSRALCGESLRRLVAAGSPEALGRALAAYGLDTSARADFQKRLHAHGIAELAAVQRLADPRSARFYGAFIERHFFENLKTILHHFVLPDGEVDIRFLLIESPELPPLDADRIEAARHINQLFRLLPPHPIREQLLPLLVELDETRDLLRAECRLDRLFYDRLAAAARGLPLPMRKAGCGLVRTEIDHVNLVMVLRNVSLYRLPEENLAELFIPGGLALPGPLLEGLAGARSRREVVAALPRALQALLGPLVEAPLYASENVLWDDLYRRALALFKDFEHPALSTVAFPFLKRSEVLNIGRVFEGFHFGLPAADILEMMIGATHV
ncbi:MAG: V-type ATPase subunit [Lentisphaeria bacterium]|nr:V-type ATPase subunit [Lentisphaeria bacterium]